MIDLQNSKMLFVMMEKYTAEALLLHLLVQNWRRSHM